MLRRIQGHLEAVYRISAPDVRHFLVQEAQLHTLLGDGLRPADEWVLVCEQEDGVDVAVFVAAAHLKRLQSAHSPVQAAAEHFDSFCVATEGVSHFLLLADRARRGEPVSMLELEVQAEVDKFICAILHHPDRADEWWHRLFRSSRLAEGLSPDEVARYTEAARLAAPFCADLSKVPHADALLQILRAFWRDSGAKRLERMRRLAA